MYKKLILMLTCSMLVVSLAGCGKNNQESAEVNEESAVDNSAADSAHTLPESGSVPGLSPDEEEFVYEPAELACSLPKGFVPDSEEEGLYVHKSYPKDLSSISYDISDSGEDLTQMTLEEYKRMVEDDYIRTYGDVVTLSISEYENLTVDHRSGLRIKMSYEFKGEEYEQLTYLFSNGDEIHNLTFSQVGDRDWMEDFEASAGTIHFVKTGN